MVFVLHSPLLVDEPAAHAPRSKGLGKIGSERTALTDLQRQPRYSTICRRNPPNPWANTLGPTPATLAPSHIEGLSPSDSRLHFEIVQRSSLSKSFACGLTTNPDHKAACEGSRYRVSFAEGFDYAEALATFLERQAMNFE